MLTPFFEIDQDEEFLLLKIRIPNLKFNNKSLQLTIDNNLLIFYLSPYYLRLKFNQLLLNEDDLPEFDLETGKEIIKRRKVDYDINNESLNFKLPKKNQNEVFTDLELTHKLMSNAIEIKFPRNTNTNNNKSSNEVLIKEVEKNNNVNEQDNKEEKKLIEEIDINDLSLTTNDIKNHIESFENLTGKEFNWQFKQNFADTTKTTKFNYGFNDFYNSIIENSMINGSNDVNELSNPGELSPLERSRERRIKENYGFNEDYYVSNYLLEKYGSKENDYDYELLKNCLNWENPNLKPIKEYSKELKKMMIELPKNQKFYKIEKIEKVYYLIIAVLFSYNLNQRINVGENNIDSAWLIGKLLPQFSYLDDDFFEEIDDNDNDLRNEKIKIINEEVLLIEIDNNKNIEFDKLKNLVIILIKRSLIYPLFRNFSVVEKALVDTLNLLKNGFKKIIEVLFLSREIFKNHSYLYVYNIIWFNDLLNYLILNIGNDTLNNQILFELIDSFEQIIKNTKKSDIVFEKLNLGDDDEEIKDNQEIELLEKTSLQELELIAEELYKDLQQ